MAPFFIRIYHDRKYLRLKVEQLSYGIGIERFKVTANNGSLIFESNRPILRKKGLKHWKPDYKLIEGKLIYSSLEKDITEAIDKHLEGLE